jgi:hypothetical protein
MVGSVYCVKRFTSSLRNSLKDVQKSQMMPNQVMPSAGKVMFNMFWVSEGVLLAHFEKHGENVNCALYCEVLLKLRDKSRRKRPGQLARGEYCSIMTVPDLIQGEQPRREFKNYNGNFLNIHLTAQTSPLVTSVCLVC